MNKTRVLLCAPNLNRGGAERMSLQLFESLDRKCFEVTMYVQERLETQLDPDKSLEKDIIYGRVGKYRRSDLIYHLIRITRLARRSDVVIGVSEGRSSGIALIAGMLIRKPVAVWIHSNWGEFSKILSWRVKAAVRLFRKSSAIIACSSGVAEAHTRSFPENGRLVRVIQNGINCKKIEKLSEEPISEVHLDLFSRPAAIAVGRLNHEKGFDLLIKAHALAREMGSVHNLVILGDGPKLGELVSLSKDLGVQDSVHFIGFQENPYRFMANATIMILSSRFEGFGLVVAEALACGTPVISFDCPSGPSEILDGGRFGVLVPPQDTSAMAKAMKELLYDPAQRKTFSERGPNRAKDYDVAVFSKKWGEVLEAVTKGKN